MEICLKLEINRVLPPQQWHFQRDSHLLIFEVAIGSNLGDSERRHQDPVRRPSILFLPSVAERFELMVDLPVPPLYEWKAMHLVMFP